MTYLIVGHGGEQMHVTSEQLVWLLDHDTVERVYGSLTYQPTFCRDYRGTLGDVELSLGDMEIIRDMPGR